MFIMQISFHPYANKTNFHKKSFALSTLHFAPRFHNEVYVNSEMGYKQKLFIYIRLRGFGACKVPREKEYTRKFHIGGSSPRFVPLRFYISLSFFLSFFFFFFFFFFLRKKVALSYIF